MTRALATLDLPLLKATAPARFRSPISVISAPLRPRVIAAITCTLTTALSRARRWMKSTSATWSMTGSVSGMTTMLVTPPAAAAWLAVLSVSRCSSPGSPVNTCISMRPGHSTWPLQSTTLERSGALRRRCAPKSAITPSLTSSPPGSSLPEAGSTRRALRKVVASCAGEPFLGMARTSVVGQLARHGLEHGHAHRDAHLHLVADDAARVIGDGGRNFHAAVHGARVHDERIRLGARELLVVEAEEVEVFVGGGYVGALHALPLQPQHHDDVGAFKARIHAGEDLRAQPLGCGRQQGGGGHDAHARPHGIEHIDIGSSDARMQDVAADRDRQAGDAALGAADRQYIKQRLGRMLVCAVTSIDDRAVHLLCQELDRPGSVMAHHQDVGAHGIERHGGVDERLTLLHG